MPDMTALSSWPLAMYLKDITSRENAINSNLADHQFATVRASIAYEFLLLGKTRCSYCHGWGHSHKICPTGNKLKHFSKAQVAASIMKRIKESAVQAGSRINNGQVAPWSNVSAGGRKRTRTEFNASNQIQDNRSYGPAARRQLSSNAGSGN